MQPLIYHVATTLDGFIAKADGSAPGFAMTGDHADAFVAHLADYAAIVMGRATYEIGYSYGLQPGELPYGERPHYIFSASIDLPGRPNLHVVRNDTSAAIDRIKAEAGGPVYLCGGGRLAGYLLGTGQIDRLRIKLNPIVYGAGIGLFENYNGLQGFSLTHVEQYDSGVMLLHYDRQ